MSDILDRIIAVKREEVRAAEQSAPLEALRLEACCAKTSCRPR
jgi:indole-3-glycerol phosphate synthase